MVSARTLMGVARGEFQQYMSLPDPIGCYPVGYWETSFGAAFGGSFDITLSDHFAWRVVQPDLYLTRFTHATQKDFRISTGLVFRFGGR